MHLDERTGPESSVRRLSVLVAGAVVAVSAAWSVVVDDPSAPHLATIVGVFTLVVILGVLVTVMVVLLRRARARAADVSGDAWSRMGAGSHLTCGTESPRSQGRRRPGS